MHPQDLTIKNTWAAGPGLWLEHAHHPRKRIIGWAQVETPQPLPETSVRPIVWFDDAGPTVWTHSYAGWRIQASTD